MEQRLFEYFFASTEDSSIKQVIEKMLNHVKKSINVLKEIFIKGNLIIPYGFTEEDVRIDALKVLSDTFALYFCFDLTIAICLQRRLKGLMRIGRMNNLI